jgi:hypothetical protein
MWFDIFCSLLLIAAFVTGMQKGLFKTFSFIIAFILSTLLLLWMSPYLFRFLDNSFHMEQIWIKSSLTIFIFLLFLGGTYQLVKYLRKDEASSKHKLLYRMAGASILSIIMFLSIGTITSFLENTKLINDKTKSDSYAYKTFTPIFKSTQEFWQEIKIGALEVSKKGDELKDVISKQ